MSDDRLIKPSPPPSRAGAALIAMLVLAYSAASFSPLLRLPAAIVLFLLAIVSFRTKHLAFFPSALALFLLLALPRLHPAFVRWPWALLAAVVLPAAAAVPVKRLHPAFAWLKPGIFDRTTVVLTAGIIALSAPALVLWEQLARPDLSRHLSALPSLHGWMVPAAGIGFSSMNAALEEFLFRGMVMQSADSACGPGTLAITAQAWVFGAAHYRHGFPNGWWGLLLASLFGLMLGLLRRRSRGMAAPWTAHAAADMVIFTILFHRSAG